MDNNIILYGGGGHCKVVIDILRSNNQVIDWVIDDVSKGTILDFPILNSKVFKIEKHQKMILTIGNNEVRKKIAKHLEVNFVRAIHFKAIVSPYSIIGQGTVVMAGAIINSNAVIGKHCIVNTGAIVEHDCEIHDFAHISPNVSLAGGVVVGEGSQVGLGSCVIQNIKIGKWAIIGAGAVVVRDVPDYAVVVGNPAKVIKINKNE